MKVPRSSMYYRSTTKKENDATIMDEIYKIYTTKPSFGYRKIHLFLRQRGHEINHKRVQRLLKGANIKAIYPGPRTSIKNQAHKVFPYLLKDLKIERPNQVWQVDITYLKLNTGFVYLICLIDVFSRRIMGWTLSTFLDTSPCCEALKNALRTSSKPEIINSDQGCQFTSDEWVNLLIQEQILISMDGKGRWADNIYIERFWRTIKYECFHLQSFDSINALRFTLAEFIEFYNYQRPHQSLNYHTPNAVYTLGYVPTKKELFERFKNTSTLTLQEQIYDSKLVATFVS